MQQLTRGLNNVRSQIRDNMDDHLATLQLENDQLLRAREVSSSYKVTDKFQNVFAIIIEIKRKTRTETTELSQTVSLPKSLVISN